MTNVVYRRGAATLLAAAGVTNLLYIERGADQSTFIGVLFVLSGLLCCAVAVGLWEADEPVLWAIGGGCAAAMVLALLAAHSSVGLFGYKASGWEPVAVWSLVIEGLYLLAWLPIALRPGRRHARPFHA